MLHDILRSVGRFFFLVGHTIERMLIILPIEGLMRLWYLLDPRVYFQSLRIREVVDGGIEKKSDVYFVFVLYTKSSLPAFTIGAFDAIARSPHNLIVVSNASLPPLLKAEVAEQCHKLIVRKNIGRDFGAYKDGINYVLEHHPEANRIVVMNDSVFFLRRSLDKLIADLTGPQDFIGVTEVHQFHYHVQSFMLSFGRGVLTSAAFRRFWKRYLPVGSRRWAIHRGEIRLTRTLTRAGFRPHILFQAAHLLPHLQSRPVREVMEATRLLPTEVRGNLYANFLPVLGEKYSSDAVSSVEAIASGIRRVHAGPFGTSQGVLPRINAQAASMEQWSFKIFPNQIVFSISQNNQMHHGGFLFIKYLGLPLLKRDIFYRELYTLEDVHQILSDVGEPLRDDILGDLRRAGSGANLRGLHRIMYRHGSL